MAYNSFKNLAELQQLYGLSIVSAGSLFAQTAEFPPSEQLRSVLTEQVPLALNINTEKARSELIIAPILVEVRRVLNCQVSLFSGVEFNVTAELAGYCDFLLSKSPDQVFLEVPVVCVVEAKNENIKNGYVQCVAEMVAAQLFNEKQGRPVTSIGGAVTTGSNWKFLQLTGQTVQIDYDEYLIANVGKLLGILVAMLQVN